MTEHLLYNIIMHLTLLYHTWWAPYNNSDPLSLYKWGTCRLEHTSHVTHHRATLSFIWGTCSSSVDLWSSQCCLSFHKTPDWLMMLRSVLNGGLAICCSYSLWLWLCARACCRAAEWIWVWSDGCESSSPGGAPDTLHTAMWSLDYIKHGFRK